jgi:ATP12 chaperone protein
MFRAISCSVRHGMKFSRLFSSQIVSAQMSSRALYSAAPAMAPGTCGVTVPMPSSSLSSSTQVHRHMSSMVSERRPSMVPPKPKSTSGTGTEQEEPAPVKMSALRVNGSSRRFYRDVRIDKASNGEGFSIKLGGHPIETPMGRPVEVPTLKLAVAAAYEWDSQLQFIKPTLMPLVCI